MQKIHSECDLLGLKEARGIRPKLLISFLCVSQHDPVSHAQHVSYNCHKGVQ